MLDLIGSAERPRKGTGAATPPIARLVGPSNTVEMLGLNFERINMQQALDRCLGWCEGPRAPHTVITANAAIICMMKHDPELAAACSAADAVVADGMSVVWSSHLTEAPLPERVTGVDLMARLLEEGGHRGLSVYLLGAKPEVVAGLARHCAWLYPGLNVVGYRNGYFRPDQEQEVVAEIARLAPDMLFVGMPSPFKETFCQRNRAALNVPLMIGVGGSFDVLAGFVRRAPRSVRSMGMEWAWRLAMEPRKLWKRYLTTNSEFLLLVAQDLLAQKLMGRRRTSARQAD